MLILLLQGASAGQLCSMEEKVLLPLQDECQCWDGRPGPVRVPRVCQEGTVACFKLNMQSLGQEGSHSSSQNFNTHICSLGKLKFVSEHSNLNKKARGCTSFGQFR